MNIIVHTFSGNIITRPDTTWVRKDEDFYVPEFIDSLSCSKVICAKISRPGKCVSKKFAERYFDSMGCGLILYPENLLDGSAESYAQACCVGHTTYIPLPETPKSSFTEIERSLICEAIEKASGFSLFRTGDIIAVETVMAVHLCSRDEGKCQMPSFDIIF